MTMGVMANGLFEYVGRLGALHDLADARCGRSLKSKERIEIYIAGETEPIIIPEKLLADASETFAAFVRNKHVGKEPGSLRFPEDDLEAWKVMLCWIVRGQVDGISESIDDEGMHLVRCWCLGDRYDLPLFQDLIMLDLLHYIENEGEITLEIVGEAFKNSRPNSKIKRLMAECTVQLLEIAISITYTDLDCLDGVTGFSSALAEALSNWRGHGEGIFSRLNRVNKIWKEFMPCDEPKKHWIFEDRPYSADDG